MKKAAICLLTIGILILCSLSANAGILSTNSTLSWIIPNSNTWTSPFWGASLWSQVNQNIGNFSPIWNPVPTWNLYDPLSLVKILSAKADSLKPNDD